MKSKNANTLKHRKQRRRKHSSTQKKIPNDSKKHAKIVATFLETLDMIKLYHWKTDSYAHHKATDELHHELSESVDRFVEVLMGKTNKRINMMAHHLKLYDLNSKKQFKTKLFEFRQLLVDLDRTFDPRKDSDLFTIRDDMLIHVNQFLYLATLDK